MNDVNVLYKLSIEVDSMNVYLRRQRNKFSLALSGHRRSVHHKFTKIIINEEIKLIHSSYTTLFVCIQPTHSCPYESWRSLMALESHSARSPKRR